MDQEQRKVIFGKYEMGRFLGKGTFAKVYYGKNLSTGESVAIKIINKDLVKKHGLTEQIKREISVMKLVKHPNVVELKEVMATKSKIFFVMELVKGGELFAKVVKGRLTEDLAKRYFKQLISAVEFCHSRGVSHRDLKPENILVDENGDLKVSDFGLSAMSRNAGIDGLLHTRCGTPAYVAPEVLRKNGYGGAEADLWSCGVVLYVLLAGFLPFQEDNVMTMYQKIFKADYDVPPWFSSEARRVLGRLLVTNSKKRATIPELAKMRWFSDGFQPHTTSKSEGTKVEEVGKDKNSKKALPPFLNAFELISSMSSGFDLSPLFEEDAAVAVKKSVGSAFTSRCPASKAAEEILAMAGRSGLRAGKDKEFKLRIESDGKKGKLVVTAEVFEVAPEVTLVEFSKLVGDNNLEYDNFLAEVVRPALKDLVWAWQGEVGPHA